MVETGKRSKEATAGTITEGGKIGGDFKVAKNPEFLAERLAMFQRIYEKQQEELKNFQKREIDITLKDGKVIKGVLFETTPLAIATKISKKLAASVYGAKIVYSKKEAFPLAKGAGVVDADDDGEAKGEEKGEIYDLTRPLEGDCTLELLNFDDPHAKNIFWHSSAHILGCALEQEFGAHLCIGPALEKGFYYDAYMGEHKISPNEFPNIEKAISTIIAADHPFKKIYLTKAEALELFKHNPFKVQLISKKIPEDAVTTAYCSGSLVDLCTGPHLPSTGIAKAFKCTKASAAYWLAKSENDDLQRVYGISFPQQKLLDEYIKVQEALIQGDHRTVGRHQNLFTLIDMSPGSAFFLPHGARIYNKLTTLMRREYALRGYTEVITPNMYNKHLWEVSGHWYKYKDNIFQLKVEDQEFGMKPMNCPGHCLMFGSTLRSYKELPIRYAEFGVLHRNEISGALSGLTRVRRFVQDDAHIFCTLEQIQSEIEGVLDLLKYVYKIFGFSYKLFLSTRPEGALGEKEIWDNAEEQLKEALNKFGHEWKLNPGDGAFYGPKIDIALCDIYGREHQCGTIQLDFNLPFRFNLQYRAGDDEKEGDGEEEAKETEKKPEGEKKGKGKKGGDKAGEEGEKKPEGEKKGKGKKGGEDKKGAAEEGEKKPEGEKKVEAEKKPEAEKKVETEKKLEEPQSAISQKSNVSFDPSHNVLKPGFQRPVMIHRAIYGSFERFIAVVTEMTGGKWPFWLSPRQIIILPISTEKQLDYAEAIYHRLKFEGFDVEVDRTNSGLNRKVRNAQMQQYNFIAVIGDEEMAQGCVDLRERDKKDRLGKFTIAKLVEFLKSLEVPDSDCKEKLWAKAYFGPDENREAYRPHTQCDHVHAKPEESKKAE